MPKLDIKFGPRRLAAMRRLYGKKRTRVVDENNPRGFSFTESDYTQAEILAMLEAEVEARLKEAVRTAAASAALVAISDTDD